LRRRSSKTLAESLKGQLISPVSRLSSVPTRELAV
jgi:hypothetical protein